MMNLVWASIVGVVVVCAFGLALVEWRDRKWQRIEARERAARSAELTRQINAGRIGSKLYTVKGRVWKDCDKGMILVAAGTADRWAESASVLKDEWERDMKLVFPIGPDYNMIYDCVVREAESQRRAA